MVVKLKRYMVVNIDRGWVWHTHHRYLARLCLWWHRHDRALLVDKEVG